MHLKTTIVYCFAILAAMLPAHLLAQSKTSGVKRAVWNYTLPEKENVGPMDISVSIEYSFGTETWGPKTYLTIKYKITRFEPIQMYGTMRYKYKDVVYRMDEMNAADGLGNAGFSDIKVLGLTLQMKVNQVDEWFHMSTNFNWSRCGEIDKNANLDNFSLSLVPSYASAVNSSGNTRLISRINNLAKAQKAKAAAAETTAAAIKPANPPTSPATATKKQSGSTTATTGNYSTKTAGSNNTASKSAATGSSATNAAENKEVNSETYQAAKNKATVASQQTAAKSATTLTNQQILNNFNAQQQKLTDDYWSTTQKIQQQGEAFAAQLATSYYTAQAVTSAKNNLHAASTLQGNYANEEELNADFSAKYASISQNVENLTNARNNNLQLAANNLLSSYDAQTQAIGQGLAAGLKGLNSLSAEKKEREAKAELIRQRNAQLARFEAEKKAALVAYRTSFLKQFPEGGVPLSSHVVPVSTIYFFAYTFDNNTINNATPAVAITNVFAITQYSDSTWPFKSTLLNDVRKLGGTGAVTLMGYYASEEMAQKMRQSFLNMAAKGKFIVTETKYKGKTTAAKAKDEDFWETDKKKTPEGKQNNLKKPAAKKETEDDFWKM